MEPWWTPILTGYICEDFPFKTTRNLPLLRKDRIRPNMWPEIPEDLSFWRRPACQTPSKALNISNTLTRVVPDLFHALAILSEKILIRSTIDREDLKSYWKSEKRLYFSRGWTSLLSTSFSKTLITIEIGLKGQQFLVVDFSPTFLNTGTTDETFHH